jgi:hypothetical protein
VSLKNLEGRALWQLRSAACSRSGQSANDREYNQRPNYRLYKVGLEALSNRRANVWRFYWFADLPCILLRGYKAQVNQVEGDDVVSGYCRSPNYAIKRPRPSGTQNALAVWAVVRDSAYTQGGPTAMQSRRLHPVPWARHLYGCLQPRPIAIGLRVRRSGRKTNIFCGSNGEWFRGKKSTTNGYQ